MAVGFDCMEQRRRTRESKTWTRCGGMEENFCVVLVVLLFYKKRVNFVSFYQSFVPVLQYGQMYCDLRPLFGILEFLIAPPPKQTKPPIL